MTEKTCLWVDDIFFTNDVLHKNKNKVPVNGGDKITITTPNDSTGVF